METIKIYNTKREQFGMLSGENLTTNRPATKNQLLYCSELFNLEKFGWGINDPDSSHEVKLSGDSHSIKRVGKSMVELTYKSKKETIRYWINYIHGNQRDIPSVLSCKNEEKVVSKGPDLSEENFPSIQRVESINLVNNELDNEVEKKDMSYADCVKKDVPKTQNPNPSKIGETIYKDVMIAVSTSLKNMGLLKCDKLEVTFTV